MLPLIAQGGMVHTLGWYGIAALVIVGILAVIYVVAKAAGVNIPPWVGQVLTIIAVVFIGVVAIKLLISFL